jgi:hypothetical protein
VTGDEEINILLTGKPKGRNHFKNHNIKMDIYIPYFAGMGHGLKRPRMVARC